ncbi:MAG: ExbD/TolR family protein [Myxococcaceae bacterium]
MAFYIPRRKLRPHVEEESTELNIVPYLDVLMNLIMFMLLSITGLSAFGILNVTAPSYGTPSAAVAQEAGEAPKLLLSVLISKKGFFVAGSGGILPGSAPPSVATVAAGEGSPTIPTRADGTYDFAALNAQMVSIKNEFPNETKAIVGAEAEIEYETLVATMDAIRETTAGDPRMLFPDVTLAAK